MALALLRTYSSTLATILGVKPACTRFRRRACLGSSIAIIDPKNSAISIGRSAMLVPRPLQKMSGRRLAWTMSSYLVSAQ